MDTSKNEDSWEVNLSPPHSTLVFPQDPPCVQDIDTVFTSTVVLIMYWHLKPPIKQVLSMGENRRNVCSFCGEESPDLLKCSRCKEMYYCSRDCQRGHWREGHREDCKEEIKYTGKTCDSERREIYASFYLPNDDPSPYFRWFDVVPGNFIAILSPCIHFFNDGTVGLRVDKASYVYCFDTTNLKLYWFYTAEDLACKKTQKGHTTENSGKKFHIQKNPDTDNTAVDMTSVNILTDPNFEYVLTKLLLIDDDTI
uniref:Uncharacterized protein n=1 Tax=Magallana gigas TaxID=29159 RepID=K1R9X6_MAGGI